MEQRPGDSCVWDVFQNHQGCTTICAAGKVANDGSGAGEVG